VSAPGDTCGIAGVRAMLGVLEGTGVKAVAIGRQRSASSSSPFARSAPSCHSKEGIALMREFPGRRRYQIDEPASHAPQLCVSHWPYSSWYCRRVGHHGLTRPARGCLEPRADVPCLGGSSVPWAYWLPGHARTKGSVHARRNRSRSRSPRQHRAALAATRTPGI
jgi:hypothetical protein